MSAFLKVLAMSVDAIHVLAMIAWGIGMPLLVWHRLPRLSRAYMWFAILFVSTTLLSQQLFGECFLTTLARRLWEGAGHFRDQRPFTSLLANTVAGIRPTERQVVLLWELAVLVTSGGILWHWRRTQPRQRHKART